MTKSSRRKSVEELAKKIVSLSVSRPLRVAIDGRTASGKTTLARELSTTIQPLGRPVIQTSIDGFRRPKIERYARGRYSGEGYYYDARDLKAIIDLLLRPLGNRRYCRASFDLAKDISLPLEFSVADANAVLIVDGTFLQRPELRAWWDFAVFIETDEHIAEARGIARDAVHMGDAALAKRFFAERYRPAFVLYAVQADPKESADAVLLNNDFDNSHIAVQLQRGLIPGGYAAFVSLCACSVNC